MLPISWAARSKFFCSMALSLSRSSGRCVSGPDITENSAAREPGLDRARRWSTQPGRAVC